MKNYLLFSVVLLVSLFSLTAQSQNAVTVTNYVTVTNIMTADFTIAVEKPDFGKYDVTFASAGSSYGSQNQVGVDFSISSNPFEDLSSLWFGVSQSVYWEPSFGGSTDVDVDWNINITDSICVLGGWAIGDVYGAGVDNLIRTGPEFIAQYYFADNAFLYGAINYDLMTQQSGQGWQTSNSSNNGWRWCLGIGVEF